MSAPVLYIKQGCPYCDAPMDYLDEHEIAYEKIEVRGDAQKLDELQGISGQTKTPTLAWNGKVLANFGVDELKSFLAAQEAGKTA